MLVGQYNISFCVLPVTDKLAPSSVLAFFCALYQLYFCALFVGSRKLLVVVDIIPKPCEHYVVSFPSKLT